MHITFITPEYPTKQSKSGGLASYLSRLTKILVTHEHEIEVFVLDPNSSAKSSIMQNGICIHYIPVSHFTLVRNFLQYGRAFAKKIGGIAEGPIMYLLSGHVLARAVKERNAEHPFDIIHASNLETAALFLPKEIRKNLVLRVSSKRDVWVREDGHWGPRAWIVNKIEEYMVRRTSKVYASSEFLKNLHERAGGSLAVIRPPLELNVSTVNELPSSFSTIPSRYFIHLAGKFGPRKGTDVLLKALPLVKAQCPDISVLFIGKGSLPKEYSNDPLIRTLGPQSRPIVYTLLSNALAAILPSTAETLPNTAIESVMRKTPVIGTTNSSIDELITPGKNGVLVPQGDPEALAEAMINVWKNGFTFTDVHVGALAEMDPEIAAQNVVEFATNKNNSG